MSEFAAITVEQSLPICCALAVIGGILEVAATAVTAVPSVREQEGKEMSPWLSGLTIAGNVTLQLLSSILSHLVATWFGPVSIVVPFFYSSTLLSNVVIFGMLLGTEFFNKTMRVGSYIIVVAVILLPVVGPTIQEDQNINLLLSHWYAILWFGLLLISMAFTAMLLILDITRFSSRKRTVILLVARACAISVNLTVSRSFILRPSQLIFVSFVVLKILSGGLYTFAIVVQSTAVEQARFVPLNATTIILVNALTGIIIWEDWKVISSWYGYCCVFVLVGLSCDLLLSEKLLLSDNPQFGAKRRATVLMMGRSGYMALPDATELAFHPELDDISESEEEEDGEGEDENGHGGEQRTESVVMKEGLIVKEKEKRRSTVKGKERRQSLTKREAWKQIAGFRPESLIKSKTKEEEPRSSLRSSSSQSGSSSLKEIGKGIAGVASKFNQKRKKVVESAFDSIGKRKDSKNLIEV